MPQTIRRQSFSMTSNGCRVTEDSTETEPLDNTSLKGVLDRVADFKKLVNEELFPARPPIDLAPDLLALPSPAIQKLHSIATTPVFLPDRRLITANGYDAQSKILVRLKGLDGVRSDMPRDEAFDLIRNELLGQFPVLSMPQALPTRLQCSWRRQLDR